MALMLELNKYRFKAQSIICCMDENLTKVWKLKLKQLRMQNKHKGGEMKITASQQFC